MARLPARGPLPEVDHLMSQGVFRFALGSTGEKKAGNGDLGRVGAEVSIATTHSIADPHRNERQRRIEVPDVHRVELGAQSRQERRVLRAGMRRPAQGWRRNRRLATLRNVQVFPDPLPGSPPARGSGFGAEEPDLAQHLRGGLAEQLMQAKHPAPVRYGDHHAAVAGEDDALESPPAGRDPIEEFFQPAGRPGRRPPNRCRQPGRPASGSGRSARRYSTRYPSPRGIASRRSRSRSTRAPAFCVTSSSSGRSKSSAP